MQFYRTVTYQIDAPTADAAEEVWTDNGPEISEEMHDDGYIQHHDTSDLVEAEPFEAKRFALVSERAGITDQIAAYLPDNYRVIGRTAIGATDVVQILIGGSDVAGWTLDDYVIPRLASGLIFAQEIS